MAGFPGARLLFKGQAARRRMPREAREARPAKQNCREDHMKYPKHLDEITKQLAGVKLPSNFRRIRLELAREKEHPEGSPSAGYIFVAPLDADGRIEPSAWHEHHDLCRAVRFRPNEPDAVGHLVRKPGGAWAFRYDIRGERADETGYHFKTERFVIGEYVSIREDDSVHTFQVASVEPV
jgi:hypothetical protein